jgi:hypothetical protein
MCRLALDFAEHQEQVHLVAEGLVLHRKEKRR